MLTQHARIGHTPTQSCAGNRRGQQRNFSQGWIDWVSTLASAKKVSRGFMIRKLKFKPYQRPREALMVILMDLSASTLNHHSLSLAKGVLAGSMFTAYKNRWQLALFGFQNQTVELIYGPASPPKDPTEYLANIRGGGTTPLRLGLLTVADFIERQSHRWQDIRMFLITDGRSNASIADLSMPCSCVVIDSENSPVRLGRCRVIAQQLGAHYMHINELPRSHSSAVFP